MQGTESFRLVVRRGPQPNQTYELNKDIVTIGRDITNDIVINDPEVSRHHLRFTRGAGGFTLEDLGSTNGTFVGGQRLTGAKPLNNGDMIGLGETVTLSYEMVRPLADPAVAATAPSQSPPVNPYAPPAQQPAYGQPQQPYAPAQQPAYGQPQQPGYGQRPGEGVAPQAPAQQPYGYTPAGQTPGPQQPYGVPPQAPPSAGYEYDPYAEEEPRSSMRLILIGCVGLSLFCCCSVVIGLVIVDTFNLWDSFPLLRDLLLPFAGIFGGGSIVLPWMLR